MSTKISALTSATTPLAGTETLPIVQSSATTKVTVANLTAGRAISAATITSTGVTSALVFTGNNNGTYPTQQAGGTLSFNGSGGFSEVNFWNTNSSTPYYSFTWLQQTGASSKSTLMTLNTTELTLPLGNISIGTSGKGLTTSGAFLLGLGTNGSTTQATLDTNGTLTVGSSGSSQADLIHLVNNGGQNIEMYYAAAAKTTWHTGVNTSSSFYIGKDGNAYKFTIADDGTASVVSNNLSFGTAAKGVNFTANTPAAGMTSQLLNWYEEGTWTPADASGAGLTFTSVTAKYTRIGRQVTATAVLTFPTTASTAQSQISGLPFAASNFGQFILTNTVVVGGGSGLVAATGTTISLYSQTGAARLNSTNSTATLYLTGTYFV